MSDLRWSDGCFLVLVLPSLCAAGQAKVGTGDSYFYLQHCATPTLCHLTSPVTRNSPPPDQPVTRILNLIFFLIPILSTSRVDLTEWGAKMLTGTVVEQFGFLSSTLWSTFVQLSSCGAGASCADQRPHYGISPSGLPGHAHSSTG